MIGQHGNRITITALCVALLASLASAQPVGPQPSVEPTGQSAPAIDQATPADVWVPPTSESMPLGLPEPVASSSGDNASGETGKSLPAGTLRTTLALGGVLLLIFALAWGFKRVARLSGGLAGQVGAGGRAPAGLVEVLARYPMGGRQTLVVIRFDRRVLLCSMTAGGRSGAGAMTTLCELDSPEDVASVLVKARDESGESIARTFERAMAEESERFEGSNHQPVKVRVPAGYADAQSKQIQPSGLGSMLRGGRLA